MDNIDLSDSTKVSLSQLPLEILFYIFRHLDVPDILRMRRVSRCLNECSRSRDVWSDAYRKAPFIRPPGPFFSQSSHDLENALVPSFRIDRNVRLLDGYDAPRLRSREIRYTGSELCVSLVFGRFLLFAFREEVRCYDLSLDASDSNSSASIIYRPARSTSLRSFHCVSAIDVDGRSFACVVLGEETQTGSPLQWTTQISICSLNVTEQSEVVLDLLYQFDHSAFSIDVVDLGPRVLVIQGRVGLDITTDWRLVALDVHTRTQFLHPLFTPDAWAAETLRWEPIEEITPPTGISTSTHLLLTRSFYTQTAGWSTFFQAFTLPHPFPHPGSIAPQPNLSSSHRGVIPGVRVNETALLHDAILDSSTRDVLITIRVNSFDPSRPRYPRSDWGVLRLSATHASQDELGTIAFRSLGPFSRHHPPFLHPSFHGTGRAFYTSESGASEVVAMVEYDVRGAGAGAGGDEPMATIREHPSILPFSGLRELLDYDPYSGQLCLRIVVSAKYRVIQILDLAV